MADQTVRIEHDDVAATAYKMAFSLWVNEKGEGPKASQSEFISLVLTCTQALTRSTNSETIKRTISELFGK